MKSLMHRWAARSFRRGKQPIALFLLLLLLLLLLLRLRLLVAGCVAAAAVQGSFAASSIRGLPTEPFSVLLHSYRLHHHHSALPMTPLLAFLAASLLPCENCEACPRNLEKEERGEEREMKRSGEGGGWFGVM
jgi:hypothetical protein